MNSNEGSGPRFPIIYFDPLVQLTEVWFRVPFTEPKSVQACWRCLWGGSAATEVTCYELLDNGNWPSGFMWNQNECGGCGGRGTCPVCDGSGYDAKGDNCIACRGSGKCSECKGSGKASVVPDSLQELWRSFRKRPTMLWVYGIVGLAALTVEFWQLALPVAGLALLVIIFLRRSRPTGAL